MAWIIISANGDEIDRRELTGPLVVGRSPECDVAVRDLLLSRTHCRIEPVGQGWKVVDLNSRNGTRVGWQGVQTHALRDGDHLRMGRTRIVFNTSPFEPAPHRAPRVNRIIRPADPHEALTGTVTDFILVDDEESASDEMNYGDRPFPQPRPLDPVLSETSVDAFQTEQPPSPWCGSDLSSENNTALAARPRAVVRALPRFPSQTIHRQIRRRLENETDLSLQADANSPAVESLAAAPQRSRRQRFLTIAGFTLAAAFGTGVVVMSIWLLTIAS